jgi:Protein of unknown function (DUF2809)
LFGLELSIATWLRHIVWLRSFVGDVLAVVLVYYGLKTFVRAPVLWLATATLMVGYTVELIQWIAQSQGWKIAHPVVRIVLGSTPDAMDLFAYTLGFMLILIIENAKKRLSR